MRKTKKKKDDARRARSARRFVKLTRAHLEMSGRLTATRIKMYMITALCVRRVGDAVVVEATNGRTAWRYPAELVDGGELPETFVGEELADGKQVLIDPDSARQCLRALPMKSAPREPWKSAYLAVDDGVGVLSTIPGMSVRCRADGIWPDFDEGNFVPERQPLCVTLDADLLCKITTWLSKHVLSEWRSPLVLSFSRAGDSIKISLDVNREGGPVGVLMPYKINGDPLGKAMPAWRAAFAEAEKGGKGA